MELYEEFILSKKLRRRIQELCGFKDLNREEKVNRAYEILNSTELKQAICHKILGTTFKDVERSMEAIIKERKPHPSQEEELELRKSHPEKYGDDFDFDYELEFKLNKDAADAKKPIRYKHYTREEVAKLIAALNEPHVPVEPTQPQTYSHYTREEVETFMRDHYAHLEEEKRRKEERAKWDSLKTTGFVPKIANTTKHTKSTKD